MVDLFTYMDEVRKEENKLRKEKEAKLNKVKKLEPLKVEKKKKNQVYTVFEITRKIKSILENSIDMCWIEGEISNYKNHSSGHYYFSLKDEKSVISCVMWRSVASRLSVRLENGQKVKVFGKLTLYEGSGKYQIDVKKIELAGVGDLQMQFEILKKKLLNEGLFDRRYKKNLPLLAKNIGVITAETGAAFQDIRKVVRSRSPFVNIYLYNARVQGRGTEKELVEGLRLLNKKLPFLDSIILGRGGGSLEDLWTFNEEIVARAVFESKIPVISAVGHEIDFSISDFVADVRAATPSHAAEIATIERGEQLQFLDQMNYRLSNSLKKYFERQHEYLLRIENSHAFKRPVDIVKNYTVVLDNLEDKFHMLYKGNLDRRKQKLDNFENMLRSLGPDSILKRGYAIVTKLPDEEIVDSAGKVKRDDIVKIKLSDGDFESIVK